MRTRNRLIAAILLVAIAAISVFYYATTNVISKAFDTIETQDTNKNTDRVVQSLNNEVGQLTSKVEDWSDWDDTYAFVENRNEEYIISNLQPSALTQLNIGSMLFYNQAGTLVFGESVNQVSGNPVATSPEVLNEFKPGSKLLATSVKSASKGLLVFPDGTFQFVALPILTSAATGPPHGTLVFGMWLTPQEISALSNQTQLNVSFYSLSSHSISADIKASIGAHPRVGERTVVRVSSSEIIGNEIMANTFGQPALIVSFEGARSIHDEANSALMRFLLLVLFDTLGAIALSLVLLQIIRRRDQTIALKNEFFSIASHELRTPLTVIRDYAQLMKFQFSKRLNDPNFDHMVDNIDQTGAQLIGLVNVYLDAARMEQGKIPFEVKPFSLMPLVTGLQAEIGAAAKRKGLTFTADLPLDLPAAMGDETRVRQVILNIIGNAMKFTDTGGITLKAEVKGKFVMVYISDTGRGMDLAAQKVLFQRFSQVRTGDARIGSGLGLFLSKKLIEQMGGTVQVESSAPGVGTSISFSLPVAPPAAPGQASVPTSSDPSGVNAPPPLPQFDAPAAAPASEPQSPPPAQPPA